MCQSLGCWSDDDQWVQWSYNNPKLAEVVWPQVVTWARHEKYYEIKLLLQFTELEDSTSVEEVESKIAYSIAKAN